VSNRWQIYLGWSDGRCFRYGSARSERGAIDSLKAVLNDSYFREEELCVGKIRHPSGWVSYLDAHSPTAAG